MGTDGRERGILCDCIFKMPRSLESSTCLTEAALLRFPNEMEQTELCLGEEVLEELSGVWVDILGSASTPLGQVYTCSGQR